MRHRGERGEALQRLFCLNLRQFRSDQDLSQEALAEKSNLSMPFLGAVERGEKWPSPQTIADIAFALGVEPYDLFKPEHTAARNVREIVSALAQNLSGLMHETVNLLNTVACEEKNGD